MQLSAKGYPLIKDAKELDALAYSDFIVALVALQSIHPSAFIFSFHVNILLLI
jgi:hypothetical protein